MKHIRVVCAAMGVVLACAGGNVANAQSEIARGGIQPSAVAADTVHAASGTAILAPHAFLNLETGEVSRSGGDIFFDGAKLSPQGTAGLYNLGKYGSRAFKSIQARHASSVAYSAAPIPAGSLVPGDIFGVHTNRGRYAKAIISARDNGTLTLQYTVFGLKALAPAASPAPIITKLQNNYSWILPGAGLPNYGIAPGSIFAILGTGISAPVPPALPNLSVTPTLPTTLNQTNLSVTVNGVTVTPAISYTSATQIAAVLPSTTPAGTGTITVSYSGQNSAATPITVVANAPGLDTLYGTGNGSAVATDNSSGAALGLANSAMPGETIALWGSGIGADAANDDRMYPQKADNLANLGAQVFIGGISANVLYAGRSAYPGLDQYDVVVPANVTPGCFVSAVVQIGNIVSNAVTLPVSQNGGACSDAASGLTGPQIQSLANKAGNVNAMAALLSYQTGGTGSLAFALAGGLSGAELGAGYEYASQGSCTIVPPEQGSFTNLLAGALDAGTIQLTGPGGQVNLGTGPGLYQMQFNASPGAYTFNGSGGKDIGKFSVSFNLPAPSFNVTNQAALGTIARSQGATVNWTGGFSGGTVQVQGSVGAPAARFFCYAPTSDGQLSIPASILLALPAGPGNLAVSEITALQTISATNLDVGLAGASAGGIKLGTTFK